MGRGKFALDRNEKSKFNMCRRKKKFKSSEASYYASLYKQRKYECPLCGHWHLTKSKEIYE